MSPVIATSLGEFFADPLNIVYGAALMVGVLYAGFLIFFHGIGDALGDLDFDLDLDVDVDLADIDSIIDADGAAEAAGVSMLAISSFVTAFGTFGLISAAMFDASALVSLIFALAGGLVFGILAQAFFLYVLSPTISSEVRQALLIGHVAEIVIPIPSSGVGQIAFVAEGSRVTYAARAIDEATAMMRGTPVRIERIVGGMAYVSEIDG